MKNFFLLLVIVVVFLGSGCESTETAIKLQQDKELRVIEAQKQKEIYMFNYEQQQRTEALDKCINNVKANFQWTHDGLFKQIYGSDTPNSIPPSFEGWRDGDTIATYQLRIACLKEHPEFSDGDQCATIWSKNKKELMIDRDKGIIKCELDINERFRK